MAQEAPEKLLLITKEEAQIYCPGRHLTCVKDPSDLTRGYSPADISITRAAEPERDNNGKPELGEAMSRIWDARYAKHFPNRPKRNGLMPGMRLPVSTQEKLHINIFTGSYLDYRLTLPKGDEHDEQLVRKEMLPYVNIHHVPITADGQMIYVTRGTGRDSWHGTILCTHSWGEDLDKDYGSAQLMEKLEHGQGEEMFRQARDGLRREINPRESSGDTTKPDRILEEVLKEDDVEIISASCITTHALPGDFGYHICFTAKLNKEAGEILEAVRKYPIPQGARMSGYFSTPFDADSMAKFFAENHQRITTSVEPAIIMACVQTFGEEFLTKLPFETIVNKRT
jgi:hypothetical protein